MSSRVSVIVPVRNDPRIDDLLASLARQERAPDFEVIVALDGNTRDPLVPSALPARLLRLPPRGAYSARNAAVRAAQNDLLLFTDSDCICPPDWMATAVRFFEDPAVEAVQGATQSHDDSRLSRLIQLEYDRMVANFLAMKHPRFCDTRNLAIRAPVARRWPLPDALPRCGDAVYGWQLSKQGISIHYEPSWRVAHRHLTSRWSEGMRAFALAKNAALWRRLVGLDFFAPADGSAPRGPGAWLFSHASNPTARRAAALALVPVAGIFAVLSAILPADIDLRAFSRFCRAAQLAGRLFGEAAPTPSLV
jgi:glycosyltransferase involved in cell wall biosynthesis